MHSLKVFFVVRKLMICNKPRPFVLGTLLVALFALESIGQNQDGQLDPYLSSWVVGNKKETVVVLHGGPCVEHTYLRPEFDRLKRVARVIYYDQRGCGQSEPANSYVWQEHVKDLERIIKVAANGDRVYLAGSSWGSALALLYAFTHPSHLKGLILSGLFTWEGRGMDSLAFEHRYRRRLDRSPSTRQVEITLSKVAPHEWKEGAGQRAEKSDRLEKKAYQNFGRPSIETRRSLATAPTFSQLATITTPKIIFNGTQNCSWVRQVKAYRDLFPQAPYVEIEGACHDPWYDDPDDFFDHAIEFIQHTKRERIRKIRRYEERKSSGK